jgi:hypothetical protein
VPESTRIFVVLAGKDEILNAVNIYKYLDIFEKEEGTRRSGATKKVFLETAVHGEVLFHQPTLLQLNDFVEKGLGVKERQDSI